jgi:hypothetical protein
MRLPRRKSVLLVLSSAAFILSICMWTLNLWFVDDLTLTTPYHATSIVSGDGGIHLVRLVFDFTQPEWEADQGSPSPQPDTQWNWSFDHARADNALEYLGWSESSGEDIAGKWGFYMFMEGHPIRWNSEGSLRSRGYMIRIPWWAIALITGVLPVTFLFGFAARQRPHRTGHCRNCGYDLRATPDRCPECGLAAEC